MRKVKKSLVEKFVDKLVEVGLSRRKASEISRRLAPVARAAVRAELKAKEKPVSETEAVPVHGANGVSLLRRMFGLTSGASYTVVAVKGETGIVCTRPLGGEYKVKFYPTMQFWGFTYDDLTSIGANDFLQREYYERIYLPEDGLKELLKRINIEAGQKPRRSPKTRLKAITAAMWRRTFGAVAA